MEKKRKEQEKEIALTKRILSQTTQEKKKSLTQLRVLNKQIQMREALIGTVSTEIKSIDVQISDNEAQITRLTEELEKQKREYAEMIYTAYKNRNSYNILVFYLSSSSFNQAVKRVKYVQQIGEYRAAQLALIQETRTAITHTLTELKTIRGDKTDLLSLKEKEKSNLVVDKEEENEIVKTLQQKEKELRQQLAQKEKAMKALDAEIKRVIEAEIKKSNPTNKGKTDMTLTPEAQKLSSSFNSNKSRLPWPVEKGFIVRDFGEHAHPTLPGIKTVNNGIDIATTDGAQARSVFEGEVRAIFSVPGMQKAVMINHGEFFTVYTHLETVSVKKGDKVTTKQSIGSIYKDLEDNKTILHFELWKGSTKLDPETWIYKK